MGNGKRIKFWDDVWRDDMPLKTLLNFHDWELDVVNNFFLKLSKFGRFREEEDKMVWKASKNEVFSVRSFYNALEEKGEVTFPSKIIWDSWAPTKVSFFSWEVIWDRILSIDQLKKRGWVLAGFRCTCKDADESVEHLLIHCG